MFTKYCKLQSKMLPCSADGRTDHSRALTNTMRTPTVQTLFVCLCYVSRANLNNVHEHYVHEHHEHLHEQSVHEQWAGIVSGKSGIF